MFQAIILSPRKATGKINYSIKVAERDGVGGGGGFQNDIELNSQEVK